MSDRRRGEVWLADLGYVAKVRPCLVLSILPSDIEREVVTLVPHTTKPRGSRFEVDVTVRFLRAGGVFECQSLVTVPRRKLLKRLGRLSRENLHAVKAAVMLWLGFTDQGDA
jgi:mRNA interferase MazF